MKNIENINNQKNEQLDQLIVRVWKICNFKCNFCNVDYNEKNVSVKETSIDLVRNFLYKFKYSQINKNKILITISWGEPSILQKETIFALKYIKKFLLGKGITPLFNIQSNASNITYNFAKKIKQLWVNDSLISFHTNDKKIFEKIIWINYSKNFQSIVNWIYNLHSAWIDVELNIIINKENYSNFIENLEFTIDKFPFVSNYNVWVIQPHWHAYKNSGKLYIQYKDIAKIYNKWIAILKKNKKNISSHFTWLPACYIEEKKYYLEWEENLHIRKNLDFNEIHLINKINDDNKIQIKECEDCIYNNICWWIWKEYEWYQILKPVRYKKVFDNDYKEYLLYKNSNIKKIYDSWVRNIIVSTDIFDDIELVSIIKKLTNIWFYKITLYITKKIKITEELLKSWVWNIQVNIKNIDFKDINKFIRFSNKYSPQFWINLDILFYDFNKETLFKLLIYNNLNIYLIYDFKKQNNKIKLFNSILKNLENSNKWKVYTVNFNNKFLYKR